MCMVSSPGAAAGICLAGPLGACLQGACKRQTRHGKDAVLLHA
jgi:hypothetical protein